MSLASWPSWISGRPIGGSPAGHRPDGRDAAGREVEHVAQDDHADHGDEGARDLLVDALQADDDGQDADRHGQGGQAGLAVRDPLECVAELLEGRAAALADAEQAAELPQGHLDADAGEEADEDAVGEEVGDEPEPQEPGDDHEHAAHEGRESGHGDPLRGRGCAGGGDAAEADRQDGSRRRVGTHDEVARRAEDGERQHGQDQGVEAGDDRHLRDLRVAHDLGHRERGQGRAGDELGGQPRPVEGQDALEDGQASLGLGGPRAGGGGHPLLH